jgi:hypothetical protein
MSCIAVTGIRQNDGRCEVPEAGFLNKQILICAATLVALIDLKLATVFSLQTSVTTYQSTWSKIPEALNFHVFNYVRCHIIIIIIIISLLLLCH